MQGKVKKGKNTIRFIAQNHKPVGCTITYSPIVVDMRPHKEDPIRVRLTIGAEQIGYPGKLLLKNNHGVVRIYENTHQIIITRNDCTVQLEQHSQSIWMNLHVNHTRNVWITTTRHPYKQLTSTTFAQKWILTSQTHSRIMVTCVETYSIHIFSGIFWNWLSWIRACRSSDECTENLL